MTLEPDPYCNARPIPRRATLFMGLCLFALMLALSFSAYLVVQNQYEPFFLQEGEWRCTRHKVTRVMGQEDDITCTRYELVP